MIKKLFALNCLLFFSLSARAQLFGGTYIGGLNQNASPYTDPYGNSTYPGGAYGYPGNQFGALGPLGGLGGLGGSFGGIGNLNNSNSQEPNPDVEGIDEDYSKTQEAFNELNQSALENQKEQIENFSSNAKKLLENSTQINESNNKIIQQLREEIATNNTQNSPLLNDNIFNQQLNLIRSQISSETSLLLNKPTNLESQSTNVAPLPSQSEDNVFTGIETQNQNNSTDTNRGLASDLLRHR